LVKFALLTTDVLLLSTLAALVFYCWSQRHNKLATRRWRTILKTPAGGSAAIILVAYVAVAGLDSLRFAESNETFTVLDKMLWPLRSQVETTYSAPLAAFGYAQETRFEAGGKMARDYPRLLYGGRHLLDPAQDRLRDLLWRGALGGLLGLAGFCALLGLIKVVLGYPLAHLWTSLATRTWRAQALVLAALCVLSGLIFTLASDYHLLGTDKVGSDVLYLTLKSIRTGLVLGVVSSLIALPIAVILGIAAGYLGGWVDDLVQYLYTTLSSIPSVLLIAAAALSLDLLLQQRAGALASLASRADMKLLALCLVLGLTGWTSLCRLLRAETLKLRTIEFVIAARALGGTPSQILVRHLLPNTFHLVIITTVLSFSDLVLAEAVLTYIDIGVDPSMESWGNMINGARLELAREPVVWWSLVAALCGMFGLVLAANLFADAVRDAFDPRLRGALLVTPR
jgi:peptide/nickel transport system permease protein